MITTTTPQNLRRYRRLRKQIVLALMLVLCSLTRRAGPEARQAAGEIKNRLTFE